MAFQDFDYLSERRKAERSRKMKRRITAIALTSLALVAVVAAGVIAVVHGGYSPTASPTASSKDDGGSASSKDDGGSASSKDDGGSASSKDDGGSAPSKDDGGSASSKDDGGSAPAAPVKQISHSEKAIKMVCSSTDYPDTCKSTLEKATEGHPAQPKELIKVAIKATGDEVSAALKKTEKFKFESEKEKGAFEDCKKLFSDAIEEINISASSIVGDLNHLSSKSSDLNSWLSAVRSYQETCVDGFPDGKHKTDMKKALKTANELSSNSLAIISQISSFLSTLGVNRHLLSEKPTRALDVDEDGFATWMSSDERRMLKGNPNNKPTPNVTVAKDGSGQFKTINEALKALPAKYTGRYVIYVKAGIYDETVIITKNMENITLFGDGSQKSIITGKKNFVDGVRTFQTASCEYNNTGPGAKLTARVNWAGYKKDFKRADAEKFTVGTFLEPDWIKAANVPVHVGLN
ncbi:hypothetical protein SAY86_003158 [Trapa natans]|uniref:Pectinesterase inhibitor domain-containing protein n=1 Tax=Trapa natans TaxID=22666 RepID=A0AAN7R057_TRANT|nr:hypothetical protein SAY86_003158 [Trapa natans]